MELHGIHHLTAITADALGNFAFYTQVLGLRLVKKTVNQDDVSAYHLFYADGKASPGTDVTFFDWPAPRETRGTRSVVRTGMRVANAPTLLWWAERLRERGVKSGDVHEADGRGTLEFEDPEGQRLALIVDGQVGPANPWEKSPVPPEHQILGLGPISLSVPRFEPTDRVLRGVLNFRHTRTYPRTGYPGDEVRVYTMGAGGAAAEVHLMEEPNLRPARQGAGAVHHVAFRCQDADYEDWAQHLDQTGTATSGPVDRYYFRSLYFREPGGILFEIATDGPGFAVDEPLEQLGDKLALPPFLEGRRPEIEAGLKPLATAASKTAGA